MKVRISAIGGIAVACALALVPGALAAKSEQLEMYALEGSAASIGEAAAASSCATSSTRRRAPVPRPC